MDNKLFKKYISIANFIAEISGPGCEVIVHDLSDMEKSIIHIANGHITGRKVGGSITNYALEIIMKEDHKTNDYVVNYIGKNEKNCKVLRSSTYYIKDENDNMVGLLCINFDITNLLDFRQNITDLIMLEDNVNNNLYDKNISRKNTDENFDLSLDEIIDEVIQNTILNTDTNKPINLVHESDNPIRIMHEKGIFNFKGSVNRVAKIFNISPQTVYRYIKELETS